jgi:type I restriction enzyme M protein
VFKPYSGVGTAILVFTKGGSTEKVWFYDMKSDGYTLDDKRDFIDGKGDIPDIVSLKFKNKKDCAKSSVLVDIAKIKDEDYNLSISRYREVEREEIVYEDPRVK